MVLVAHKTVRENGKKFFVIQIQFQTIAIVIKLKIVICSRFNSSLDFAVRQFQKVSEFIEVQRSYETLTILILNAFYFNLCEARA